MAKIGIGKLTHRLWAGSGVKARAKSVRRTDYQKYRVRQARRDPSGYVPIRNSFTQYRQNVGLTLLGFRKPGHPQAIGNPKFGDSPFKSETRRYRRKSARKVYRSR